jgi:hypothetical protein
LGELTRHVAYCENLVNRLPQDAVPEEYVQAEEELSSIIADITELARYLVSSATDLSPMHSLTLYLKILSSKLFRFPQNCQKA